MHIPSILVAPPSAARNFTVASIVDDTRPGFYGHAVIGLEWDLPEGESRCALSI